MRKTVELRPTGSMARPVTIRMRVTCTPPTPASRIRVADLLLQPGNTATGWVAHVTEMPWLAGVVGG